MFCGTGSFAHVDENPSAVAPPSPKGSKKKHGGNKNPYSTRGLDKFSTVLSELEARREKIMATAGSGGVSMVRFMYSNSQDWIPVIVKLRDSSSKQDAAAPSKAKTPLPLPAPPPPEPAAKSNSEAVGSSAKVEPEVKARKEELEDRRRWKPSYYWPVVMVVILLCLVMFGRVFAICCTSVWWYLVPTMKGEDDGGDRRRKTTTTRKKKENGFSVVNLGIAPSSQIKKKGGVQELQSPRSRAHRNR